MNAKDSERENVKNSELIGSILQFGQKGEDFLATCRGNDAE
jgi:hypothetical protein